MKVIRDNEGFYTWLTWYMQNTGPTLLYPKPVADFAEFMVTEPRTGLNRILIDEDFGGGGGLKVLFKQLSESKQRFECRTRFIDCAISLYEETFYDDEVDVGRANWLCVFGLELEVFDPGILGHYLEATRPSYHGYFREITDDGSSRLISTKKFEHKFGLKVALTDWKGH